MNRRNLQDHLSSYYADCSLAPDKTERLAALAEADLGMTTTSDTNAARWSTRSMLGLAASVAIIASGLTMLALESNRSTPSDKPPVRADGAAGAQQEPHLIGLNSHAPRLVAVKFQVDGCPLSEAVEAKFVEMRERFGKREVLFCRLNISTTTRQQQSRYLAETLGIDCVYDGPCRSGTLVLVDREKHELVAVATDATGVAKWESALARALP